MNHEYTPQTLDPPPSSNVASNVSSPAPVRSISIKPSRLPEGEPPSQEGDFHPSSMVHKITMGTAVVLPFLGVVAGAALMWSYGFMGWLYLSMIIVGWLLTGLGITVGFHRLLTHRSFDTYPWVRAFWMAMGALSIEGSPIVWCAVHRKHHQLSDHEGDPHSPHLHGEGWWNSLRGLWHAHVGWLFTPHWTKPQLERFVPDLVGDKLLVAVDRFYWAWVLVSLIAPAVFAGLITWSWQGALLGFLWGGLVRIFVTHHITWSINSICHVFGQQTYVSNDDSRNNLVCGVLGLGEGWHNNHHAFPTSARHGLAWWQFDLSWIVIRTMALCGLAWNIKLPSERQMELRRVDRQGKAA